MEILCLHWYFKAGVVQIPEEDKQKPRHLEPHQGQKSDDLHWIYEAPEKFERTAYSQLDQKEEKNSQNGTLSDCFTERVCEPDFGVFEVNLNRNFGIILVVLKGLEGLRYEQFPVFYFYDHFFEFLAYSIIWGFET